MTTPHVPAPHGSPALDGNAIQVEDLVKRYGTKCAVDGLSFEVRRGEIFALLGPNGAGKTTTVEILEGFRRANRGQVQVLGLNPTSQAGLLKQRIGVMLQDGGLYPAITPREALALFARFYQQAHPVDELLELVGLQDASAIRYRRLSGGQKKRLALAIALVGCPELIFLDEPTAGLDPHARRTAWEIIAKLRDGGATILLTTHYLDEAERLADHVAIVDRGHLIALGTPPELSQRDTGAVRLRTARPADPDLLRAVRGVTSVRESDGGFVLQTIDAPSVLIELTAAMRDAGVPIVDLRVGQGSLEDVFLELTGREFEP